METSFNDNEPEVCETCGAKLVVYSHRLNPLLVKLLGRVYSRTKAIGSPVFSKHDFELSHSEYANFPKLQYWGIIARHTVDGLWDSNWVITRRGELFIENTISLPISVKTFRGKAVQVPGDNPKAVTAAEAIGGQQYVQMRSDYRFEHSQPGTQLTVF